MSIPGAPNPVKWSDIYNTITGTIHNGSTSIKISDYIGQIWSDNTFVPSKDISIDKHFRGKSMPTVDTEVKIKPYVQKKEDTDLLIDYAPVNAVYDYSWFNFIITNTELIESGIKTRTGIQSITFQLSNWQSRFPGTNNQTLYIAEIFDGKQPNPLIPWAEAAEEREDIYIDGRDVNGGKPPVNITVKNKFIFKPNDPEGDSGAGKEGITEETDPVSGNTYIYYKITFSTVFTWSGNPGTHLLFKWYNGDGSFTYSGIGDLLGIQGETPTGASALIFADDNRLTKEQKEDFIAGLGNTGYPVNHRIHSRPNITLGTTEPPKR